MSRRGAGPLDRHQRQARGGFVFPLPRPPRSSEPPVLSRFGTPRLVELGFVSSVSLRPCWVRVRVPRLPSPALGPHRCLIPRTQCAKSTVDRIHHDPARMSLIGENFFMGLRITRDASLLRVERIRSVKPSLSPAGSLRRPDRSRPRRQVAAKIRQVELQPIHGRRALSNRRTHSASIRGLPAPRSRSPSVLRSAFLARAIASSRALRGPRAGPRLPILGALSTPPLQGRRRDLVKSVALTSERSPSPRSGTHAFAPKRAE
jgi:hypothetical protein